MSEISADIFRALKDVAPPGRLGDEIAVAANVSNDGVFRIALFKLATGNESPLVRTGARGQFRYVLRAGADLSQPEPVSARLAIAQFSEARPAVNNRAAVIVRSHLCDSTTPLSRILKAIRDGATTLVGVMTETRMPEHVVRTHLRTLVEIEEIQARKDGTYCVKNAAPAAIEIKPPPPRSQPVAVAALPPPPLSSPVLRAPVAPPNVAAAPPPAIPSKLLRERIIDLVKDSIEPPTANEVIERLKYDGAPATIYGTLNELRIAKQLVRQGERGHYKYDIPGRASAAPAAAPAPNTRAAIEEATTRARSVDFVVSEAFQDKYGAVVGVIKAATETMSLSAISAVCGFSDEKQCRSILGVMEGRGYLSLTDYRYGLSGKALPEWLERAAVAWIPVGKRTTTTEVSRIESVRVTVTEEAAPATGGDVIVEASLPLPVERAPAPIALPAPQSEAPAIQKRLAARHAEVERELADFALVQLITSKERREELARILTDSFLCLDPDVDDEAFTRDRETITTLVADLSGDGGNSILTRAAKHLRQLADIIEDAGAENELLEATDCREIAEIFGGSS